MIVELDFMTIRLILDFINPAISKFISKNRYFSSKRQLSYKSVFHLNLVSEFYDYLPKKRIIHLSACTGKLDVLKWIYLKDHQNGDTKRLKLSENSSLPYTNIRNNSIDVSVSEYSALHGHISVLKWLYEIDNNIQQTVIYNAIEGNHINILRWIRSIQPNSFSDPMLCFYAAFFGKLRILKWFRYLGTPWDKSACVHLCKDTSTKIWIIRN